jgi:hypothetical protein
MFEYAESKNPGPQYPDIFAVEEAAQRKQAEYFLSNFQNVIREHSKIERARFRSAQQYRRQPRDWIDSHQGGRTEINAHRSERVPHVPTLQEYNAELRQWISGTWRNIHLEDQRDSRDDRAAIPTTSVPSAQSVEPGLEFQAKLLVYREAWSNMARDALWCKPYTDQDDQSWLKKTHATRLLQLLCVDAATTTDASRRTHLIDVIFLYIYHPEAEGDAATWAEKHRIPCDVKESLAPMVEQVTLAFVYMNIVASMTDGNHSHPLLKKTHQIIRYRLDDWTGRLAPLPHRPAYMNTRSFCNMRAEVHLEHGALVYNFLLDPMLAPYASGLRPSFFDGFGLTDGDHLQEGDLFEDLVRLREDMKSMWKVLVSCNMIFQECRMQFDWEYIVACALYALFPEPHGTPRLLDLPTSSPHDYSRTHRGLAISHLPHPSKS